MKTRIPYGSVDVGHVPPPDPETFWPFREGETRTLGEDCAFRVAAIHDTWIEGQLTFGSQVVDGALDLDLPVVILRTPLRAPSVTLTLRKIEAGTAYIQVTADPELIVW